MDIQRKTARLTVLLDPSRKQAFERACHDNDMTPSQVLRHLIRDYIAGKTADVGTMRPIAVKPMRAPRSPSQPPAPRPAPRRAATKR